MILPNLEPRERHAFKNLSRDGDFEVIAQYWERAIEEIGELLNLAEGPQCYRFQGVRIALKELLDSKNTALK